MLEVTKRFTDKTWAASTAYDSEFSGNFIRKVCVKLDGTVSTSTGSAGTTLDDGTFLLLGTQINVEQNNEALIRMSPGTMRHIAAYLDGGYKKYLQPAVTSGGGAESGVAMASLDFRKMMPRAGIDARTEKCHIRGTFGALTAYGADTNLAFSGTLRPWLDADPHDAPANYFRPSIVEREVALFPASTEIPDIFRFTRAQVVPAFAFKTHDASATASNSQRPDGLLRRLKMKIIRAGEGDNQPLSITWGQLRQKTMEQAGWTPDDYDDSSGFAMLRLIDRSSPMPNGAPILNDGDQIEFTYDSSTTAEGEFTSITPASGDLVSVTKIAFDQVNATTGQVSTAFDAAQLRGVATRQRRAGRRNGRR